MGTVGYSENDSAITMWLYRNMKKTEIEQKITRLKEKRENCDDYQMAENYTKKIIRLKNELKNL